MHIYTLLGGTHMQPCCGHAAAAHAAPHELKGTVAGAVLHACSMQFIIEDDHVSGVPTCVVAQPSMVDAMPRAAICPQNCASAVHCAASTNITSHIKAAARH